MHSINEKLLRLVQRGSFVVVWLSIAIFLSQSCASIRTDEVTRTVSSTTVSRGGISVEFSLSPSVRVDHPVEMIVNLMNDSQTPITYRTVNHVRELNIEIVDSHHEIPKVTLEGERQWRPTTSYWGQSFHELKQGESMQWHVDLSNLFLLPPGKYSVSAGIGVATAPGLSAAFSSGTLEFIVRPHRGS